MAPTCYTRKRHRSYTVDSLGGSTYDSARDYYFDSFFTNCWLGFAGQETRGGVVPSASQAPKVVSVLVADQSRMVGQLLASSLARKSRFKIVGTAVDVEQSLQIVSSEQAQVAVVAANLKDGPLGGFSLLRRLRASYPRTRTIVLL